MRNTIALVVDDDQRVRDTVVKLLAHIGIDARPYATAEELLAHLFPTAVVELADMPDLLIIDLQLEQGHMQGADLIRELAGRNVPSSLMAISGVVPPSEFANEIICFGAAVLLPKPFSISEFCPRAKRLAEIGKRRRLKRIGHEQNRLYLKDETRKHRPVFISYAHEDENFANGIRIHIESLGIDVWYAPTTLDAGDEWQREIVAAVDNASVLIPIFTDHFLLSPTCLEELACFLKRMASEKQGNLLLLPIVGQLSPRGRTHEIFSSVAEKYHCVELFPRAVDCITALTWPLQEHIARCRKQNACRAGRP